ncbi:protein of unknown function [Taphrina deformans PYCC 5710]|uniref:Phosphatidylinositol-specific phospholipase C X domain-containing protein n=1 Tax=Taphrina deformans (strain PYCC 5710 / ATCC 11124 / CBS 356.35 / IMI 108563 / JCM 9778 / NBRC 8474) TaxID=1097556 RepID=R4XG62_TAPDE|nr:protein of unknown function [Taphrina deformans PYCC 5710]|eukprot:CCG84730.1 protein of unknown function [Taphrina deformans PYCC 5710]
MLALICMICVTAGLITIAMTPISITSRLFPQGSSSTDTYFSKATSISLSEEGELNDHRTWMSAVPDETYLTEINLPGTHDSSARLGGDSYMCQSLSLIDQLILGVRFLDIRLDAHKGVLRCQHGSVYQQIDFSDVLNRVSKFLLHNPAETVVVKIQQEHSTLSAQAFGALVSTALTQADNIFNSSGPVSAQNKPTLGQLRGQILIMPRSFDLEINTIPYEALIAQDDFKADLSVKSTAITTFYNAISKSSISTPSIINTTDTISIVPSTRRRRRDTATDAAAAAARMNSAKAMNLRWFINYFSLHNNVQTPRSAAYTLNPLIAHLLSNVTSALVVDPDASLHSTRSVQQKGFGVIMMDFIGPESARLIIDSNFR